jgi:hypothetical protein
MPRTPAWILRSAQDDGAERLDWFWNHNGYASIITALYSDIAAFASPRTPHFFVRRPIRELINGRERSRADVAPTKPDLGRRTACRNESLHSPAQRENN